MNQRQLIADFSLVAVVAVWGATFVMVQDAVMAWPVFSFLALRFWIASVAFVPFLVWRGIKRKKERPALTAQKVSAVGAIGAGGRRAWLPGVWIGLALCAGYAFQTFGLLHTTPAKAGFITGMSVVMVPVGAALFLKQRVTGPVIFGVILATFGLALISLNATMTIGLGDGLVFLCAISFAIQILLISHYAPGMSALNLAVIQVLTTAVGTTILALIFELPTGLPPIQGNVIFAAVFTGLLATTFAFSIQSWAQRFTSATHTVLIFSLEPVFAALSSYLLIGELLTGRILSGGGLILAGMLVAELGRAIPAARWWARLRRRTPVSVPELSD
ncbi:MAG: DMT family transporter [Caldilineaceae bacterium]|nr:DMT family transporter [Caldilineaceae bacterium]MBP8109413.1 DMT family transporter [Caldilineaceae bacterium]MBP8124004.1 DMT family transporter [Caldilineaceae bacterium]MBP9074057.1 DMT family transporter [Caldilineaceae bacterium]